MASPGGGVGGREKAPELCVEYSYVPPAPRQVPATSTTAIESSSEEENSLSYTAELEEETGSNADSPIRVYPNPANSELIVDFNSKIDGQVQLQARNLSGQVILTKRRRAGQGHNTVSLKGLSLPNGIYFLQVFLDGKMKSAKFIIQHE